MTESKKNQSLRNYFTALGVMAVLVILFLNSFVWPADFPLKRIFAVAVIALFLLVAVPFLAVKFSFSNKAISRGIDGLKDAFNYFKTAWRDVLRVAFYYAFTAGVALLLNLLLGVAFDMPQSKNRAYFLITIGFVLLSAYLLRKLSVKRPEVLFLVIVLLIGTMFIAVSPAIAGVSWDDQIHYDRTLNISNFLNGVMYDSDKEIIDNAHLSSAIRSSDEQYAAYINELERLYEQESYSRLSFNRFGVWSATYFPAALGIMLSRGLGLSWTLTFMMGKFFNLVVYSLVFYYAIKRIKGGKMLIAAIGLIPTSVFMAATYSYDWWIIAFTTLGFSYFFAILQEKEKAPATRDIVTAILAISVGSLAKPLYVVLLFPILFAGKILNLSKKQKRLIVVLVFTCGILLAATFVAPFLITGPYTDIRAGGDVNGPEQLKFILGNPLRYIGILFGFLKGYLSLEQSASYIEVFAYLGAGTYFVLPLLTIWVMAFVNKGDKKDSLLPICLSGIFAIVMLLMLIPTALYIEFTPVGSNTISGCQQRYLLPILFPAIYLICGTNRQKEPSHTATVQIPMLIMAAVFMENMWQLLIK